jgi:hypothetical protein
MIIKDGLLGHFWSTDGSECLWCSRLRTAEEIEAWKAAGEPFEVCIRERLDSLEQSSPAGERAATTKDSE